MKISLTVKTKDEFINGKRVVEYGEKAFELDVSLNAQGRWEKKFPDQAAVEELLVYSERIKSDKELTPARVISKMKVLYCYIVTDLSFTDFLKLFDFSIPSYANKLVEQLTAAFDAISEAASEKN